MRAHRSLRATPGYPRRGGRARSFEECETTLIQTPRNFQQRKRGPNSRGDCCPAALTFPFVHGHIPFREDREGLSTQCATLRGEVSRKFPRNDTKLCGDSMNWSSNDDPISRESRRSAIVRRLISHGVRTKLITRLTGVTRAAKPPCAGD